MRRWFFYLVSLVYGGFLICWIYLTGRYGLGFIEWGSSRVSLGMLMPAIIGIWPSYLDYIRQMIKKGEFSIKLESWEKGRIVSYLVWTIIFSLQAYIAQDPLLYLLAVVCLVVAFVLACQYWEVRKS